MNGMESLQKKLAKKDVRTGKLTTARGTEKAGVGGGGWLKHFEHTANCLDKHVTWEQLSKAGISRFRF